MASIEIFGDDGYVLIDDTYKNLIIASSFTATFPASPNPPVVRGSFYDVRYTSPVGDTPALAVSSTFPTVMSYYERNGNAHWWRVYCSADGIGKAAQFYILNLPQTVPNANGILQIFNAQGTLVFDSELDYCKASSVFATTMARDTSVQLTAGRKYAHVLTIPAYTFSALPASGGSVGHYETNIIWTFNGLYYTAAGTVVGTRFTYSQQQVVLTNPPGNSGQTNNDSTCLIIDVTGIPIRN